jgi:solute carrier family 25 phosphate transporter 3
VNPNFAKGTIAGMRKTWMKGQFVHGWLPTAIGYSFQGCGKFGFYEIFKDFYSGLFGPERALKYRDSKKISFLLTF